MLADQMNNMFAEGGVMQEGGTVDPVSGNEVPPGAMQEEVRDDIDAKLSEGEFVFPADVVRFIGLQTLMKLRDKAKSGLKRMEEIGQMGNAEEVPDAEALHGENEEMDDDMFSSEIDSIMSEDDEEDRGYSDGGYVVPENKQIYRDAPIKGFEMVPMVNDAGQTMYIPFINGVAQLGIPAGYRVRKSDDVAKTDTTTKTGTATIGTTTDGGGGGDSSNAPSSNTPASFSVSETGVVTPNTVNANVVGTVASITLGPVAGLIGKGMAQSFNSMVTNQANAAATSMADNMAMDDSPAATAGPSGTGVSAAVAGTSAASAATAAGMSDTAAAAAGQAAANATIGGATPSEAANIGAAAAISAAVGEVSAEAAAAAPSVSAPEGGTVGSGGVAPGGGEAPSVSAADGVGMSGMGVGTGVGVGGSGDGDGGAGAGTGNAMAKGGFVSKKKTKTTSKPTGLAARRA